ncbi:MAG: hypothetical protein F4Y84_09785 [Caldilineaceae bacterium SB0665_bin_25]|nr:hypothetical protein [Caldilineaceae bacterium SB0665_bin_25]
MIQLNQLEQKFFSSVLCAKPEVPIRGRLEVNKTTFPLTIIPLISQDDYFELRYFGAPPYQPKADSTGVQTWHDYEMFGVHPKLEKAWKNRDILNLRLVERPNPFVLLHNVPDQDIDVRVLLADLNHQGSLAVHENQVPVQDSAIKRAEFSLVDFPEIVYNATLWLRNLVEKKEFDAFQKDMKSAVDRVDDDNFSIHTKYQNKTLLLTDDGWEISLVEDEEQTRGCNSYTGTITREDGGEFDCPQLRHVLEGLTKFFSFATCAYRHPTAVIAYGTDDTVVWGQIGRFDLMSRSDNWLRNASEVAQNAILEFLFPKFWTRWEAKKNEFSAAIEYYVSSRAMQRSGFPQNAVATTYAGLDLIAHLVLTNPKRTDSVDNISRSLYKHGIPHQTLDQSKTPIIFQTAQDLKAQQSGVKLLNKVRNYVAHPIDFNNNAIKQDPLQHLDDDYHPYFYIHDLGQFYLEYLLLKEMCDYTPAVHRPLYDTLHRV